MPSSGALFYNARIIDGYGGEPLDDGAILVEGDTLAFVGSSRSAPATPPGVVEVDVGGRSILPGFIDCHVHLAWPGGKGLSPFESVGMPTSLRLLSIVARLRATIQAGVTTVRDCMGLDLGFKLAVERGVIVGPRLVISNTMLCSTGGHGDFSLPNGFDPYRYMVAPDCIEPYADGPDACRGKVRELTRAGSDFIKLSATGGVSSPTCEPDWAGFTVEEMRAIVEEAQARGGRVVAAHCMGREGIQRALEAGVMSVEHGTDLTDELRTDMVRRGAVLVPTAVTVFGELDPTVVIPSVWEQFQVWKEIGRANLPKAVAQGVSIAMGTDCGLSTPHGHNLLELGLLVRCGMTPMAAIVAGTSTAAKLLQLQTTTGTLEQGKRADLLVIDGDPLTDISCLADPGNIRLVMKDGMTYKEGSEFGLDALYAAPRT